MRSLRIGLAVAAASAMTGRAHDYWIAVDPPRPAPGQPASVFVRGGHSFPSSAFAIQDALVSRCTVRAPDGTETRVATVAEKDCRSGVFTPESPGPHVLDMVLKRPKKPTPDAWIRSVIWAGARGGVPGDARGEGLEISVSWSDGPPKIGDELQIAARDAGAPVAAEFTVLSAGGRPRWLTAKPDTPATLEIRSAGEHLISFERGGAVACLWFVAEAASP